jgi:hypothetical protein
MLKLSEEVEMANKYVKICSTSLAIKAKQSYTEIQPHLNQNSYHQENK